MACVNPLALPDRTVDCGKCYFCKLKRINGWVLRLQEERKLTRYAYFITLTYENETNDQNSDVARITPNGRRTLVKSDLQRYFRSVRKLSNKFGRNRVKYYAVGEYGAKSGRPHYHAIVFGATDMDLRTKWLYGFVHVGTVTSNSIAYCLKYIAKGRVVPIDGNDDRQKEFSLFSKKLGTNYLTPAMIDWHRQDPINRCCAIREGGMRYPLPRYYKDRIFTSQDKRMIEDHYAKEHIDAIHLVLKDGDPVVYNKWKNDKLTIILGTKRIMDYMSEYKQKF